MDNWMPKRHINGVVMIDILVLRKKINKLPNIFNLTCDPLEFLLNFYPETAGVYTFTLIKVEQNISCCFSLMVKHFYIIAGNYLIFQKL